MSLFDTCKYFGFFLSLSPHPSHLIPLTSSLSPHPSDLSPHTSLIANLYKTLLPLVNIHSWLGGLAIETAALQVIVRV